MAAKYLTIARDLRNFILSHQSITTYKLPTEQEMCDKYGVSRQTIRQALLILEEENLIIRIQGSGAYILPQADYLRKVKIVLLVCEENEYIYPQFIADVSSVLTEKSLRLDVRSTHNDVNTERRILQELLTEHISLLVVEGVHTSFPNPNIDLYRSLMAHKTDIMFIGDAYPEIANTGHITMDNRQGGYLLGKQMIMNERYDIWAILPDYAGNAKERFHGFLSAYSEKNLPIPTQNIYWYSQRHMQALYERNDTGFLSDFVKHHAAKCNGVFCYNDEIAYWLIKELNYAKIPVPERIAVVGFDNSYLCTLSRPPISTLALDAHEPGISVGNMISDHLFNKKSGQTTELPWKYISRGSL